MPCRWWHVDNKARAFSLPSSQTLFRAAPSLVLLDIQHVRAEGHVLEPGAEPDQPPRDNETCHYVNRVV